MFIRRIKIFVYLVGSWEVGTQRVKKKKQKSNTHTQSQKTKTNYTLVAFLESGFLIRKCWDYQSVTVFYFQLDIVM